jgi:hypothetical protein
MFQEEMATAAAAQNAAQCVLAVVCAAVSIKLVTVASATSAPVESTELDKSPSAPCARGRRPGGREKRKPTSKEIEAVNTPAGRKSRDRVGECASQRPRPTHQWWPRCRQLPTSRRGRRRRWTVRRRFDLPLSLSLVLLFASSLHPSLSLAVTLSLSYLAPSQSLSLSLPGIKYDLRIYMCSPGRQRRLYRWHRTWRSEPRRFAHVDHERDWWFRRVLHYGR